MYKIYSGTRFFFQEEVQSSLTFQYLPSLTLTLCLWEPYKVSFTQSKEVFYLPQKAAEALVIQNQTSDHFLRGL